MGIIARQFGLPTGPVGRLVGRFMARNNGNLNRWLVEQVAAAVPAPRSVVELGSGPGVGLQALLAAFPHARVVGADPSSALQPQAERRNRNAIADGRLRLVEGDAGALRGLAPVDLVVAVHVLYFWHQPHRDLKLVAELLDHSGRVALGYQLKRHMPAPAQRDFPTADHRLYESDDDVRHLLHEAGFQTEDVRIFGDAASPGGRLLLASLAK